MRTFCFYSNALSCGAMPTLGGDPLQSWFAFPEDSPKYEHFTLTGQHDGAWENNRMTGGGGGNSPIPLQTTSFI